MENLLDTSCKKIKAIVSPFYGSSRRYNSLKEVHSLNKDWQHLRKDKLTASNFGSAVGFWPGRRVQLWEEKIGAREPFTGWDNINKIMAFERYMLVTGNEVFCPKFQVYSGWQDDDNWLGASADGVVDCSDCSSVVLEIKCPYFGGLNKEKSFPWKRVPIYFIPQAQGLMEIYDRDTMHMYCWTLNGTSLFRLHRDPRYWDVLKIALSDFWWEHVHPAKESYTRYGLIKDPRVDLRWLMPPPKHKLHREIVYMSKFVVDNSELLFREIRDKI